MTTARRTTIIRSAALLVTMLLAGCSAPPVTSAASTAPIAATPAAASPEPTFDVGGVVAVGAKLAADQMTYKMPDGTLVVVGHTTPLPEVVRQDIITTAEANPLINAGRALPTMDTIGLAAGAVRKVGKEPCVIVHAIPDPTGSDWSGPAYYTVPFNHATDSYRATEAEAVADCEAKAVTKGLAPGVLEILSLNYERP